VLCVAFHFPTTHFRVSQDYPHELPIVTVLDFHFLQLFLESGVCCLISKHFGAPPTLTIGSAGIEFHRHVFRLHKHWITLNAITSACLMKLGMLGDRLLCGNIIKSNAGYKVWGGGGGHTD
jgi:hypothetical protein